MIYLLDTNVISETVKSSPNDKLLRFLSNIPNHNIAISVLTIGEIRKGIEKLEDDKKKTQLIKWLEIDLVTWFQGRILIIDEKIADKWGYISASSKSIIPAVDGLIAATAMAHGLKLVTRNVKDFSSISGLELLNPWE